MMGFFMDIGWEWLVIGIAALCYAAFIFALMGLYETLIDRDEQ